MAAQPCRRNPREAQGQGAAAGRAERCWRTVSQQGCPEGIRHHQATFFWDQYLWEAVRDSEVEAVRKVAVGCPLAVGPKIGRRNLDLDDDELARSAKSENIGASAVGERELDQTCVTKLSESTADAPRQKGGANRFGGESGHDVPTTINRIIPQGERGRSRRWL